VNKETEVGRRLCEKRNEVLWTLGGGAKAVGQLAGGKKAGPRLGQKDGKVRKRLTIDKKKGESAGPGPFSKKRKGRRWCSLRGGWLAKGEEKRLNSHLDCEVRQKRGGGLKRGAPSGRAKNYLAYCGKGGP